MQFTETLGLYAYDGYVLACAERQRAPLLTLDRGMKSAAKKSGIALMEIE
ncbi:MAG: type II toxin-antitoxin system VapC family toxin [Acidobacteria bacterium]|nr:type II toxin-antitoxin system VapC family toxin [Acidobacteriota bacterium]